MEEVIQLILKTFQLFYRLHQSTSHTMFLRSFKLAVASSPINRNHFIVTPEQLADRYRVTLDNPAPEEALRGDLTSMVTYTKLLYSYPNDQKQVSLRYYELKKAHPRNLKRKDMDMKMLKTDARKFNYAPYKSLYQKGFNADVKKELYRYPSILLLDICIVSECT